MEIADFAAERLIYNIHLIVIKKEPHWFDG